MADWTESSHNVIIQLTIFKYSNILWMVFRVCWLFEILYSEWSDVSYEYILSTLWLRTQHLAHFTQKMGA